MEFVDFQIRAWVVQPDRAQVIVHSSPVGDMRAPVSVAYDAKKVQAITGRLADRTGDPGNRTDRQFVEAARQLSKILLPRPVFTLLVRSLERVAAEDGLRLRLCLDEDLVDLPWECLYRPDAADEDVPGGFVALDPRVSLVREAPTAALKLTPSRKQQRLVFVSMVYAAESLAPGAEDEYGQLSSALTPVREFLSQEFITAAGDGIEAALRKPTQIFHYTGATGEVSGKGFLGRD